MSEACVSPHRLAERLTGQPFPTLRLGHYGGAPVSVPELGARLVLYFYPGAVRSPEDGYQSPLRDSVQHRAFANRHVELVGLGYAIVGVSSQALDVQRRVIADTGVRHTLLSDPGLALAQTLSLPTFRLDQAQWYRRLVVVMEEDRIVAAFYPVTNTAGATSKAVAWIRGSGEQVA